MFKKDIVINKIYEGLRGGERIAFDRSNNILPQLALLKTTVQSEWWVNECPFCNDSFRENDLVRKCPVCDQAYHDDPAFQLLCWKKQFEKGNKCSNCNTYTWDGRLPQVKSDQHTEIRTIATMEEQFLAGLSNTWEVFGNAKIYIIKPGDFIIGNACPMCRYKLRLGDRVVKCPCSPGCTVYYHNDVLRNWTCWNEWNGEQGKDYCPISSKKYLIKSKS